MHRITFPWDNYRKVYLYDDQGLIILYLVTFLKILIIVILVLISVAFFTLAERKILGAVQRRRGPNVVGTYGLLQPLSDGFKLFVKEAVIPSPSNAAIFVFSPVIGFILSMMGWAVIPYDERSFLVGSGINVGILYLLSISSLGVYSIIMSGWSSNSKYAFLGALRSTAQMVSYEITIGFIMVIIVMCSGSFGLQDIIDFQSELWNIFLFPSLFLVFCVCALAETNRHPFDLPEAEAELVSGYNVEYSGMAFALFSLSEYSNILIMSSMITILFLGGWTSPFSYFEIFDGIYLLPGSFWYAIKVCFFIIFFVLMRAILPRYRYDQLMTLGWKIFLPYTLAHLVVVFFILYSQGLLPW
jgi:NADH-quinone oxidoreductase subunit H